MKYYVTMTDKFMSGWGQAEGKKNKLVFECDSYEEAGIVWDNARHRGDQKYVNITTRKPHYPSETHYTQYYTKEDYPRWYEPGYFENLKTGGN